MVTVRWITMKRVTKEQARVVPLIKVLYVKLLKEFKITRSIPLYLVDNESWLYKTGLNMNPRSVAHYNTGIKFTGGRSHEAVLVRESVLFWDDVHTALPRLLKHELVHAKVKNKEKGNEHAKPFKKMARRFKGVAMEGDY
jgi:hypothetical protein